MQFLQRQVTEYEMSRSISASGACPFGCLLHRHTASPAHASKATAVSPSPGIGKIQGPLQRCRRKKLGLSGLEDSLKFYPQKWTQRRGLKVSTFCRRAVRKDFLARYSCSVTSSTFSRDRPRTIGTRVFLF